MTSIRPSTVRRNRTRSARRSSEPSATPGWRRTAGVAMRSALLAATLAALLPAGAAHAQPAGTSGRASYAIAPGPLGDVLAQFAAQAHVPLSFDPSALEGIRSLGLSGRYSVQEGFDALLNGTGYAPEDKGNGWSLRRVAQPSASATVAGEQTLAPVAVTAGRDRAAASVNPATTVGSKFPVSQRELPQSVTVVSQQQIQQQNMQTLNDAMRATPGISIAQDDSERTTFYSRGFPVTSWLLDGVPTVQNLTSVAPNLAMFDRVEVLRGPDGFLNGFGSEGGAVNLVRKRAPSTFSANAELFGGTYSDFGGMLDVGGPLNQAGTLRGRVVGDVQTQHLMQDSTWRHDKLLYGTLEADLTRDTLLRVGASFSEMDQKAMWTGLPSYSNYTLPDFPRSTYLGAPWNDNTYFNTTAFAELDQKLAGGWNARLAFNYLGSRDYVLNGTVGGPLDPATNDGTASSTKWHQSDDQESLDAVLSGPVRLLGRTHQLTVGASWRHENLRVVNDYCSADNPFCSSPANVFSNLPEPSFDGPVSDETTTSNEYGLYGNARISLADPLTLVVGARVSWWNSNFTPNPDANYWGDPGRHNDVSGRVTPYAGLIYDINNNYSVYASYTSIFQPQSTYDMSGNLLKPLEGEQYEVGVKGEYFGGKLNTALALFQLTEKNRALSDPRFPGEGFSIAAGKARSKGFEATATGQLTNDWSVFGGYTYTQTEYLDHSTNPTGIGFSSIAPKHLFKLWTHYQLPGRLHPFSVGGGAYVSSGISATDGTGTLRQGGFATVDLRFGYQVNRQLSAAVNVTNLFDRRYFASIEGTGSAFYGNPRQVLFTLRYAMQ
ncbi:outer membrane receptor for ferric coprogen and ferric-rhodotorulic acid [Paraburkholderia caballeronis]|nr:outer membrane receptor for ferric coprogen and ferric-rhodotorulic acid [Paraburkholderia caballeronis]TDV13725.1 outer membrane receptor for ferric coprogen and ferric-rhodotorulic acid [Paraburkholderia caballeronis]TDV22907.1 outer membrane receptor for ferric coprogen and ferric-rhodotorulic acid [Paraburkholderia caballeronis]